MKRLILVMIILIAMIGGLVWWRNSQKKPAAKVTTGSLSCVVVSWAPNKKILKINCNNKSVEITYDTAKVNLITFREVNGAKQEYPVMEKGMNWGYAFCSGDKIAVVLRDGSKPAAAENISEVRDLGPKECSF
jgi:hypothetical protein